jgi:ribonucleoside-triphosphate reductase (formate)
MKGKEPTKLEQEMFPQGEFSHIRKRDGRLVPFDSNKITQAIRKAGRATGEFSDDAARHLTRRVVALAQVLFSGNIPSVEGVQEVVEEVLLGSPWKTTAKAYVIYRDQHARIREIVANANADLVDGYLGQHNWKVRECSNSAYSLQGLNNFVSAEVSQVYWLRNYPPAIRYAHACGAMHIHDLAQFAIYCVGWDLSELLLSGFRGVAGKVESRPARHFRTALLQIVNFLFTLQGEAAGAQAFANIDTRLAPFIRADGLAYVEVKQCLQEFIFNLNVPTRVGFQTPFTNVSLDLQPPANLANEPVIIGGQYQSETYGEYSTEMALFNRALLEVFAEGDAAGRVFSFPIPTYSISDRLNWDDPNLEALWSVTAKYGVGYFANFVRSDRSLDDVRAMCCRLQIDLRSLQHRGGGHFGASPLTGSVGVVTINMPRLGFLARTEGDFLERLDRQMDIARDSLEIKRKIIEKFTDAGLYPYSKFYLRHVHEHFGHYWENHFSTIGLVGMNEACLNFLGCDIGAPRGLDFALRVLEHMRDRLQHYQEETGHLFNLEATPAESACYRLASIDQERHPGILCANQPQVKVGASPYYTNSSQLPVDYGSNLPEVLELQEQLQAKYTGGTVLHVYLGEAAADPQAVKRFIRKTLEKYSLPYLTITPTFSVCPSHGYLRGVQPTCPECGSTTEVYSRIVGYMRPVSQWNAGKQAEFSNRKTYRIEDVP